MRPVLHQGLSSWHAFAKEVFMQYGFSIDERLESAKDASSL
jgi:hypothetical protein